MSGEAVVEPPSALKLAGWQLLPVCGFMVWLWVALAGVGWPAGGYAAAAWAALSMCLISLCASWVQARPSLRRFLVLALVTLAASLFLVLALFALEGLVHGREDLLDRALRQLRRRFALPLLCVSAWVFTLHLGRLRCWPTGLRVLAPAALSFTVFGQLGFLQPLASTLALGGAGLAYAWSLIDAHLEVPAPAATPTLPGDALGTPKSAVRTGVAAAVVGCVLYALVEWIVGRVDQFLVGLTRLSVLHLSMIGVWCVAQLCRARGLSLATTVAAAACSAVALCAAGEAQARYIHVLWFEDEAVGSALETLLDPRFLQQLALGIPAIGLATAVTVAARMHRLRLGWQVALCLALLPLAGTQATWGFGRTTTAQRWFWIEFVSAALIPVIVALLERVTGGFGHASESVDPGPGVR